MYLYKAQFWLKLSPKKKTVLDQKRFYVSYSEPKDFRTFQIWNQKILNVIDSESEISGFQGPILT